MDEDDIRGREAALGAEGSEGAPLGRKRGTASPQVV